MENASERSLCGGRKHDSEERNAEITINHGLRHGMGGGGGGGATIKVHRFVYEAPDFTKHPLLHPPIVLERAEVQSDEQSHVAYVYPTKNTAKYTLRKPRRYWRKERSAVRAENISAETQVLSPLV